MGKNEQKEKLNMNLAEKIFQERKKLGLSQEQFAEKMEISRQAVSKWESGQSMPDLDKVVMMSQIFGVSTDYLLKEEDDSQQETDTSYCEQEQNVSDRKMQYKEETSEKVTGNPIRELSAEEIETYQKVSFAAAKKIAVGVFLCIFGVVATIGMDMLLAQTGYGKDTDFSAVALLICVAVAVGLFVSCGMKLEKFVYFKKESFVLPESIEQQLKAEAESYYGRFSTAITSGVVLIIIGVIVCVVLDEIAGITKNEILGEYVSPMVLLFLVAIAVYLFVSRGMKKEFYSVVLQENDFTAEKKDNHNKSEKLMGIVAGVYWCVVTAGFLAYSFITNDWSKSWIVWPVAGCLFGAIAIIISICGAKDKEN